MPVRAFVVSLLIAALTPWLQAEDIEIPGDAPTIADAVAIAEDGDRLVIGTGDWFESIDLAGKALVLEGIVGAEQTTLHGTGGAIVVARGVTGGQVVLRGLTLEGGSGFVGRPGETSHGGAIYVEDASVLIERCHVHESSATADGGALYVANTTELVTVRDSLFRDNSADGSGGAIAVAAGADPQATRIVDSTFRDNSAGAVGGAIVMRSPDVVVEDNVFRDNTSSHSGGALAGLFVERLPDRNEFWNNASLRRGGAVAMHSVGTTSVTSTLRVTDTVAVGNTAGVDGGAFHLTLRAPEHAGVRFERSLFARNEAGGFGGALALLTSSNAGELLEAQPTPGDPVGPAVAFGDVAVDGGALGAPGSGPGDTHLVAEHVTFADNVAQAGGSVVAADLAFADALLISDSILWPVAAAPVAGAPLLIERSIVEGGAPGVGNLDVDPGYFDAANDIYAVRSTSPARGSGLGGSDVGALAYSAWTDLGHGMHGTWGRPHLSGSGVPGPGATITLHLDEGAPFGPTALLAGFESAFLPFKQGTVVPVPVFITPYTPLDAQGERDLSLTWPSGVPAEFGVFLQYWSIDLSGDADVISSNGVVVTQPSL